VVHRTAARSASRGDAGRCRLPRHGGRAGATV